MGPFELPPEWALPAFVKLFKYDKLLVIIPGTPICPAIPSSPTGQAFPAHKEGTESGEKPTHGFTNYHWASMTAQDHRTLVSSTEEEEAAGGMGLILGPGQARLGSPALRRPRLLSHELPQGFQRPVPPLRRLTIQGHTCPGMGWEFQVGSSLRVWIWMRVRYGEMDAQFKNDVPSMENEVW